MPESHEGVVVVHFKPHRSLKPRDAPRLAGELRGSGVRPVIVRVAPSHVEVEVAGRLLPRLLKAASTLGRPLRVSGPWTSPRGWGEAFLRLAGEQRFWEAHTAAEAGWRLAGIPWAKALAAVAGALAKAQEGLIEASLKALRRAVEEASRLGLSIDGGCLEREARRAYEGLEARIEGCLGAVAGVLRGGEIVGATNNRGRVEGTGGSPRGR